MSDHANGGVFPTVESAAGIVGAFSAAVQRDPDRTAIVAPSRTVTVGGLARAVEQLSERLRSARPGAVLVTPEDAVALAAGVIASADAGRPCVLADPGRPTAVLRRLAARVGATVVVTGVAPLEVSDVGDMGSRMAADPADATDEADRPAGAEVWIPTSGTTGDPSLVGITGAALLAMAVEAIDLGIVVPGDRVARLATHLGIGPLLTALILDLPYVALDVRRLAPGELLTHLAHHDVTYLHLAPTLLRMLLPERRTSQGVRDTVGRRGSSGPPLRLVGSGGEALRWGDVARVRHAFGPDVEVLHTYSSTEAGIVTLRRIGPDEHTQEDATLVPVGRPLPGRDVWIDAGDGVAAPPGTVGEILVDGRFGTRTPRIEPHADGRQRLRTGDLGTITPEGELTVVGRVARDGKVGLWRVDLAAVESAIATLDGVRDVVVRPDGSADARRLVAHVVIDERADVTDDAVRSAVGALTSAAVPARIVRHTGPLPTLASGKVARAALEA